MDPGRESTQERAWHFKGLRTSERCFLWLLLPPAHTRASSSIYRHLHVSPCFSAQRCLRPSPGRLLTVGLSLPDTHTCLHCLPPALARPLEQLFPRLPCPPVGGLFSVTLAKPDTPFRFIFAMFLGAGLPLCPHCYWAAALMPMTPCLQLVPSSSGQIAALLHSWC